MQVVTAALGFEYSGHMLPRRVSRSRDRVKESKVRNMPATAGEAKCEVASHESYGKI